MLQVNKSENFFSYRVGSIEVSVVSDGYITVPLAEGLIPGVSLSEVQRALNEARLPTETITTIFAPLLIRSGSKTTLIDTGFGPDAAADGAVQPSASRIIDRLRADRGAALMVVLRPSLFRRASQARGTDDRQHGGNGEDAEQCFGAEVQCEQDASQDRPGDGAEAADTDTPTDAGGADRRWIIGAGKRDAGTERAHHAEPGHGHTRDDDGQ